MVLLASYAKLLENLVTAMVEIEKILSADLRL